MEQGRSGRAWPAPEVSTAKRAFARKRRPGARRRSRRAPLQRLTHAEVRRIARKIQAHRAARPDLAQVQENALGLQGAAAHALGHGVARSTAAWAKLFRARAPDGG